MSGMLDKQQSVGLLGGLFGSPASAATPQQYAAENPPPLPAWAEGMTLEQAQRTMELMAKLPPAPETNTNRHTALRIDYKPGMLGGLL